MELLCVENKIIRQEETRIIDVVVIAVINKINKYDELFWKNKLKFFSSYLHKS